jgi:hypothetical protein
MKNQTRFICWTLEPSVNQYRVDILLDMMTFIREGLQPRTQNNFVDAENFVKAVIFDRTSSLMMKSVPKRMYNDHGDTLEIVATTFTKAHSWTSQSVPVAAFRCGKITDALQKRLNSFWHPDVDDTHGSLATAFDVTYSNFIRTCTRLTLLQVTTQLLQLSSPQLPAVWEVIREELWASKLKYQRDLLLFGALMGGKQLKTAMATVAAQTCFSENDNTQFSLVQFMTRDGVFPGQWCSSFTDGLRDDIKAAYSKMMAE